MRNLPPTTWFKGIGQGDYLVDNGVDDILDHYSIVYGFYNQESVGGMFGYGPKTTITSLTRVATSKTTGLFTWDAINQYTLGITFPNGTLHVKRATLTVD